jgi:hypothetical protein
MAYEAMFATPPRPTGAAQRNAPSSKVCLARGLNDPSGEVRLARGLYAPSGGVRRARGLNAPSGRVRLAQGLNAPRVRTASLQDYAPSGGARLARGHLHTRRPRTCTRVWAFNPLTPQDARHNTDTPGNRVSLLFHRLPGGGHPSRCLALCDEAGVSHVTLCRLPPYG